MSLDITCLASMMNMSGLIQISRSCYLPDTISDSCSINIRVLPTGHLRCQIPTGTLILITAIPDSGHGTEAIAGHSSETSIRSITPIIPKAEMIFGCQFYSRETGLYPAD